MGLIKSSIKVFKRYPIFLAPLLVVWLIYAPIVIYLKWFLPWEDYSLSGVLAIVFGVIFIFALLLTVSCSVLLELIQQLETGRRLNIVSAFGESIYKNLLKIIPLALIWAIIWFVLVVLEAILRRKEKREKEELSARNVAKTLAGYKNLSWWGLSFDVLKKGIRMLVFLMMPGFTWEGLSFSNSIKKGFVILRLHFVEFAKGFALTELAAIILFLPAMLLIYITGKLKIVLPDWVWIIIIIYIAFAWSYSIYLEQMFAANLYLWHLKWKKECGKAKKIGKGLPTLRDIQRPSVLDEVPDLLGK